jgi:amino acid adenylation domain-containing protein/FkbH-like protein
MSIIKNCKKSKNIEAIYPLSPLQEGILYHSIYSPTADLYIEHYSCLIQGNLNLTTFDRSWQRLVERHPALRTQFAWEKIKKPLQVVCKRANFSLNREDWRSLSADEQKQALQAFPQSGANKGFNLKKAPLMRCSILQLSNNTYQFVWGFHHLILDGWSVTNLFKELFAFYDAFNQGKDLHLDNPRPYRDYIVWLQKQDLQQAENFWRETLSGFMAPTALPVGRWNDSNLNQQAINEKQHFRLSKELTAVLQSLAQQHRLTLNTLLQGAWAILLSRYSGESDVVFGTPVSGRPPSLLGVESMVGLCINTLPVRVRVSEDDLLLPWLKQLQAAQVEREQYSYCSLVDIQNWSEIDRPNPLFESMLVVENVPVDPSLMKAIGGLTIDNMEIVNRAHYPLAVVILPDSELSVRIDYDSHRFDADVITRMIGHFRSILEGMTATPEQQIGQLSILTEEERSQILVEWNQTDADYPSDKCIHQLFEEQVQKAPDAVAAVYEEQQLTYQQLDSQADQLAAYLQTLGIGPEMLVGICMERSLLMVVAILGVLKAGGAYVPLDPAYPKDRLAYMLSDSQVTVLLTQVELIGKLPAHKAQVVCLDRDWKNLLSQGGATFISTDVKPENLAYVIYTSGSTGKPKGVMIQHQGLVNLSLVQIRSFNVQPDSRILQFASFSFDASIWEIIMALCSGASLHLAPQKSLLPGANLVELLRQRLITHVTLPPSALAVLPKEELPALKVIIVAGEACSSDLVAKWSQDHRFFNAYGPSEATVCTTVVECSDGSFRPPIGHPISNFKVYILDHKLQPLPIGVAGELYISGIGLARGYLNRPELSGEKFIPNPFSQELGSRLYKTGDLARYLQDGNIDFIGRIDHQVKLRGFRIEIGEVEAAIAQHPVVQDVAVIVWENPSADKSLVAYFVPEREQIKSTINSEHDNNFLREELARQLSPQLRNFLKQSLPDYMVPSTFIMLDALPLTPNGKLDRRALPDPNAVHRSFSADREAPRTPTEEIVAAIMAEVLGLEQVGRHENFFELGGHSLLATKVISRLREAFNLEVPVQCLFESPTATQLSHWVDTVLQEERGMLAPAIKPTSRDGEVPLSFIQESLWLLNQLDAARTAYNMPMALQLNGSLHVSALEQAITEIVRRHEVLRTTFEIVADSPMQVINPKLTLTFPIVDLQHLPEEERAREIQRLIAEETERLFDLAMGPLVRVTLLRLNADSHVLLLVMHHIISDGWSLGIFVEELSIYYQAFCRGQSAALPDLPIQYADFAKWQRQWLQGEVLESQISYWKKLLVGAPPLVELPTDRPRPSMQTFRGAYHSITLSNSLLKSLKTLSHQYKASLFATLLAALKILLFKWTAQTDLLVGTVVAGRNRAEIEPLIGCFMNFLALRSKLNPQLSALEFIERVSTHVLEAFKYQDCPFEKVVEAVNPNRELSHNPIYNVALLVQNFPIKPFLNNDLDVSYLPLEMQSTPLDLRFMLWESTDKNILSCDYNTDLFDQETIRLLVDSYCEILEKLTQNPKTLLADFIIPNQLESQAKVAKTREQQLTLAIAATFTAEPIEEVLAFWMEKLGISSKIEFAPYNQVFQELLDPSSRFSQNEEGTNVILLRLEDWLKQQDDESDPTKKFQATHDAVERNVGDFLQAIKSAAQRLSVPFLVCLCPVSPALLNESSHSEFFKELEQMVASELNAISGIYAVTSSELKATYPVLDYYDLEAEKLGHIPYTPAFYRSLGTIIARKLYNLRSNPYKVIALDCDNTLWKGVCGEDGAAGVEISPPYYALQEFMVKQQQAGKLICLCSKNNEEDVFAVFDYHQAMPLQRHHLVASRLNWNAKSENLKSLAEELQLGLDSFIFVDDNPVECAEVQANSPQVLTIQLPQDSHRIEAFLQHMWAFDNLKVTMEDTKRTELYRQNVQRELWRQESLSFEQFLGGLELKVEISSPTPDQIERVSQLTQRTNQFNFTTIRRTVSQIQQLCESDQLESLVVEVKDRFGQYGIVGVMLFNSTADAIAVDSFLLSCRVLGRGVEYQMLAHLGKLARNRGLKRLDLRYIPSPKNQPAQNFIEGIGSKFAKKIEGSLLYQLPIELAAEIVFQPERENATSTSDRSPQGLNPVTALQFRAQSALLHQFAEELSDVRQVLQAIELQKQRERSGGIFVPPRDNLELQLSQIWEEVLGVRPVGVQDNFFELGGNSLMAVRLLSQMQQFGSNLPLATLFQNPTIETLACLLRQQRVSHASSSLVAIQAGGSKKPLFCIHPGGGNVLCYFDLSKELGQEQPFYALQSLGLTGEAEPLTRLEDMAVHYLEAIREVQPEGPYLLLGWSFGGLVAFEMAQQLSTQGQEVDFLGLLDTYAPSAAPKDPEDDAALLVGIFEGVLDLSLEELRRLNPDDQLSQVIEQAKQANLLPPDYGIEQANHILKVCRLNMQAARRYVPKSYPGHLTVFPATEELSGHIQELTLGWSELVLKEVTVCPIAATHQTMVRPPHVRDLAKQIRNCTNQIRFNSDAQ